MDLEFTRSVLKVLEELDGTNNERRGRNSAAIQDEPCQQIVRSGSDDVTITSESEDVIITAESDDVTIISSGNTDGTLEELLQKMSCLEENIRYAMRFLFRKKS